MTTPTITAMLAPAFSHLLTVSMFICGRLPSFAFVERRWPALRQATVAPSVGETGRRDAGRPAGQRYHPVSEPSVAAIIERQTGARLPALTVAKGGVRIGAGLLEWAQDVRGPLRKPRTTHRIVKPRPSAASGTASASKVDVQGTAGPGSSCCRIVGSVTGGPRPFSLVDQQDMDRPFRRRMSPVGQAG